MILVDLFQPNLFQTNPTPHDLMHTKTAKTKPSINQPTNRNKERNLVSVKSTKWKRSSKQNEKQPRITDIFLDLFSS